MRHIIPISGKDSLATALVQTAIKPDLPYELFFNDVGCELPETYSWLERVERELRLPVHRIGKSLEQIIYHEGILPAPKTRFCTRKGKILPMEEFIGEDEATVYFGIRADEDRAGYVPVKHKITPVYPLKELGLGLKQVYQVVNKRGLKPPSFFWKTIYDGVLSKLRKSYGQGFKFGVEPEKTLSNLPEWYFDSLFAWRTRSNCYFCFFQRVYEWVGLLEHHPKLFARAEQIETEIGDDKQENPYTWIAGLPLPEVRKRKDQIIEKRIRKIIKTIKTTRIPTDPVDLLAVTSCGLFCGK